MPKVPTLDAPQVGANNLPQSRLAAPNLPDVGAEARGMGQATMQAGNAASRIALDIQNDANQVRIEDASNQLVQLDTQLRAEMMQLQGRNALERPDGMSLADEYQQRMKEASDGIVKNLGNEAQRAGFKTVADRFSSRLYSSATEHMVKQQDVVQKETWGATIKTATDRGVLLWADEGARAESLDAIAVTVDKLAAKNGWDAVTKERALQEAVSPMHAGIVKSMILGDRADLADAYYKANSAAMTMQDRANLQNVIADASSTQQAENAADMVWAEIGPKNVNDPAKLFDMEQALRERLADNPDARKKGIAALRERFAAFNNQQAEVKAAGINTVWGMIDDGTPMRRIQNTEAWLALPEKERHDIRATLEREANTRSSTEVNRLTQREKLLALQNGGEYLRLSNPEVLAGMSRAQVEAQRGVLGTEPTKQLLGKWDALHKPGALGEAKVDTEDFNTFADQMGVPVYAKNNSEAKKRAIGELKYRVETLIDSEQRRLGRVLGRDEKQALMKREISAAVTVEGGFFSGDKKVPVINLAPEQLRRVVVPPADRTQILDALSQMRAKNPNNPAFAPTEDNIKRWYTRGVSPAGSLIPAETDD